MISLSASSSSVRRAITSRKSWTKGPSLNRKSSGFHTRTPSRPSPKRAHVWREPGRGLRLHLEDRVFIHGNKTVVFSFLDINRRRRPSAQGTPKQISFRRALQAWRMSDDPVGQSAEGEFAGIRFPFPECGEEQPFSAKNTDFRPLRLRWRSPPGVKPTMQPCPRATFRCSNGALAVPPACKKAMPYFARRISVAAENPAPIRLVNAMDIWFLLRRRGRHPWHIRVPPAGSVWQA